MALLPAVHTFYQELKSDHFPLLSSSAKPLNSFSASYRLNNTSKDSAYFEMKPRNTSSPANSSIIKKPDALYY